MDVCARGIKMKAGKKLEEGCLIHVGQGGRHFRWKQESARGMAGLETSKNMDSLLKALG